MKNLSFILSTVLFVILSITFSSSVSAQTTASCDEIRNDVEMMTKAVWKRHLKGKLKGKPRKERRAYKANLEKKLQIRYGQGCYDNIGRPGATTQVDCVEVQRDVNALINAVWKRHLKGKLKDASKTEREEYRQNLETKIKARYGLDCF